MLNHVKAQAVLLVAVFVVTAPAYASAPQRPLPFGDGALIALGSACVVAVVWLVRNKVQNKK